MSAATATATAPGRPGVTEPQHCVVAIVSCTGLARPGTTFGITERSNSYLRSLFVFGRGSKRHYQIHPIRKLYLIFVNLNAPHYLWRIAGDPFTFLFRVMYYYFCNVTYVILVLFTQIQNKKISHES